MIFALVDCNNFYVSCERLFNPALEHCPVLVLSNNDGCVVARSQEVKKLGIAMGEPFFKIRELCQRHGIVVCSSNYQLYGDISQRIMQILSETSYEIQIYSIDEAFMRYPEGMSSAEVLKHATDIRRRIKKWVGIPVSIGIGPTKTLAKVANHLAKKQTKEGIASLCCPTMQEKVLRELPLNQIWGIASRSQSKLNSMGIYTAWELQQSAPAAIRKRMGVTGERILWELRGVSCLPLLQEKPNKSITCSRSFGRPVTELSELYEAISTYVVTASRKLRDQHSCASALYVYVEYGSERICSSMATELSRPTHDTSVLIAAAKQCMQRLFQSGQRYKKCGVVLVDLVCEESVVPDLFSRWEDPKRKVLAHAIDEINDRLGRNTVFYGAMGVNPAWKERKNNRSSRFTTAWDELPIVRA